MENVKEVCEDFLLEIQKRRDEIAIALKDCSYGKLRLLVEEAQKRMKEIKAND